MRTTLEEVKIVMVELTELEARTIMRQLECGINFSKNGVLGRLHDSISELLD